jgi:Flp pilus assembly protein TadG
MSVPTALGWAAGARRSGRRARQRGGVLVMYTLGALAVVGMAGAALDMGMVYLTKTRLQNALDAAALDGAKQLFVTGSVAQATAKALTTLGNNITIPGGVTPVVEASDKQSPFASGGANPKYLKVTVADLPVPVYLLRVLGFSSALKIGGTALAGQQVLGGDTLCGAVPIGVCGSKTGDTNCADGSCYGITPDAAGEVVLGGSMIGPGNFGLLRLDCSGAACLREAMAGGKPGCFKPGGTVDTQPGQDAGPVAQGLNTRFGVYSGPGVDETQFPPDVVTLALGPGSYDAYQVALEGQAWDRPDGTPQRRLVLTPVLDCAGMGGGATTVSVIGAACFYINAPVLQAGGGEIHGQLVGSCAAQGEVPGTPGSDGPSRIVLFQSTGEA